MFFLLPNGTLLNTVFSPRGYSESIHFLNKDTHSAHSENVCWNKSNSTREFLLKGNEVAICTPKSLGKVKAYDIRTRYSVLGLKHRQNFSALISFGFINTQFTSNEHTRLRWIVQVILSLQPYGIHLHEGGIREDLRILLSSSTLGSQFLPKAKAQIFAGTATCVGVKW